MYRFITLKFVTRNCKNMNDHTQRINEIMQKKMMNATQFSEAIGIRRAAMSHITMGRNNPSADVLTKILERFTDINPGWLMTGIGKMQKSTEMYSEVLFNESHFQKNLHDTEKINEKIFQTNTSDGNRENENKHSIEKHTIETENLSDESKKIIEKEVIIYKERPSKTIDKLLIFYSDRTFETFVPEKNES